LFGKRTKGYHRFYLNWWKRDLDSMVRRDRNHPSIIIWSVGNELFEQHSLIGVYLLKKMMKFIRTLDNTRPITHGCNGIIGANRSGFAKNLDIVGYNYFGVFGYKSPCKYDLDHIKYPKRIIIGSETSSAVRTRGVYHFPANQNVLTHTDMQCSSYDNSWVSWGDSAQTSWRALRDRPFVAGEFIWTGLDYLGEPTPYQFPAKSSYFGIIDTCGFPKDIYYFYQSQWTQTPVLHILPHWNWENQVKSETLIPVWVYTNCDEAELFLNGKSMGIREYAKTDDLHLEWSVPYVPGELKAVGKKNGQIILTSIVKTTGPANKIHLIPDRSQIKADGKDLSFITVQIEDLNGNMVPDAQNLIEFSIEGMGTIVGLDNGNPICLESYQGKSRSVFNGMCLIIVRGLNQAGSIFIIAKSDGLQSAKIELQNK
jgi:beta-galactosidase